jgi:phage-related protein
MNKKIQWEGSSCKDLLKCPKDTKRRAGYELFQVQHGEDPSDWKPMNAIGQGVKEIRIHINNEYRIIYVAKFVEAIYVLHVFEKKTQKTSKKDIELAKKRYKDIIDRRKK